MKRKHWIISHVLAGAFLAAAAPSAAQEASAAKVPDWFRADVQYLARDGGRWSAVNANPSEPYEKWGMEWRASPDGTSLTGRLFGIRDERESGDLWQFRQFWHPTEKRAYVLQWGGGGMYGVGHLTRMGEDWGVLEQQFHMLDGRTFRIGHIYRIPAPDQRVTEQYDVLPNDGSWRLDHKLTWRRERSQ